MKVWVYVEGPSDCSALEALWRVWRQKLQEAGWGIRLIPLDNKSQFFRKIGARAVEKLVADSRDLVVGLPDYYPNRPYAGTPYQHVNVSDLLDLQQKLVSDFLVNKGLNTTVLLQRFYPSALKHDLEMLLLAASDQLRVHLGTSDQLGNWRNPVEDQNQLNPPKRVIEQLYMQKKGRAYLEIKDSAAVLSKVSDLSKLLYSNNRQLKCPVFKKTLDWIGDKTGIPAY